ncbi:hypothetical protein ARMA_2177 [Ardenticatena maritima]|uniref:FAD-binding domain-containing protein n=1 Tax=Ardenticatena maritima TaxID=872965 RepID=A0A0M9UD85_9CHLR|nr:NAD(P)/FAD-dependent oxidoreductase [Ardenticatena maritima]KPL88288.1 hypothetical protein SE16_05485 [Ardenticatena maritima]GAP63754.1 hypothetical protein ARMA_2177 [Ardenticatena maritima]
MKRTQVAIIGAGPGGATAAAYLRRAGIECLLIEKDPFPRYHIGESLTGECGAIIRDLGLGDEMARRRHPVKHGVKVFGPTGATSWYVPVMRREGDTLVDSTTWQVRRSDFDAMLLEHARAVGADFMQGEVVNVLRNEQGDVIGVQVRPHDSQHLLDIDADVVVDASGLGTFLSRQDVAAPRVPGRYAKQVAIFSQIANPVRGGEYPDDTLIFYGDKHHWAWFIPLDDEIVSVGVTAPGAYVAARGESKAEFLRRELHELNPNLAERITDDRLVEEVRAIPNFSYNVPRFTGRGFLCIGDAHRFIDPIFSFGVYMAMKEAQLAADAIRDYLDGAHRDAADPFAAYAALSTRAQDALQETVDGFWDFPLAFAFFVHQRYREDFIDIFAGRLFNAPDTFRGLQGLRNLRAHAQQNQMASTA